jgi:hypothetical protein
MAGLRFTDLQSRPMEFLDFTSVTLAEFQQLVPPFETAFHARMAAWRMDGRRCIIGVDHVFNRQELRWFISQRIHTCDTPSRGD